MVMVKNVEREVWRTRLATEQLNQRNYARCEWKCIYVCIQNLKPHRYSPTRVNALQRAAGRILDWKLYVPSKIFFQSSTEDKACLVSAI